MSSLADFADQTGRTKPGFKGLWDTISPEHKAEAIEGYRAGIPAPIIRRWIQEKYPDLEVTQQKVDAVLYKQYGRTRD